MVPHLIESLCIGVCVHQAGVPLVVDTLRIAVPRAVEAILIHPVMLSSEHIGVENITVTLPVDPVEDDTESSFAAT